MEVSDYSVEGLPSASLLEVSFGYANIETRVLSVIPIILDINHADKKISAHVANNPDEDGVWLLIEASFEAPEPGALFQPHSFGLYPEHVIMITNKESWYIFTENKSEVPFSKSSIESDLSRFLAR